jgi:hypothetical protein
MTNRKKKLILAFILVIFAVIACVVVVGGAVGWYYFYGPCGKVVTDKADKKLMEIYSQWLDALKVANSTGRIALSGPITNLQSIRQDTQNLKVPTCLKDAKDTLLESMNNMIDGFLAFAGDEGDSVVQEYFDQAGNNIDTYIDQILEVRKCVPLCYLK